MGMIIVMGVPGAGKSTVLKNTAAKGRQILNYGDLMFEIAQKKFNVKHRDEIRKLDIKSQSQIQSLVAKKLAAEKRSIILDTHCSVNTPRGYLPGLPFSLLSRLKVDGLVLITAPMAEILARRRKDMEGSAGRVRELDEEGLVAHEGINRAYLAAYSSFTGAPACIIINRDGGLSAACEKLSSLL
ncbi:Adenylate kinase [Candidatus Anstonella stagnisolia]|nr:Adenylate kinase [Candidatus Anstonella stagnisolia]